jgi:hypothetical protein
MFLISKNKNMKILYKYSLIIASAFVFFACEKETEDISRITYYCELQLLGDEVEFTPLGGSYSESGWEASENGEDVSESVTVTGTVNANVAGLYRLVYSVNNTDGFPKTAVRQVVVYDTTASEMKSGFYAVSPASNRNGTTVYGGNFTILIYQVSPGRFYVSDLFGGYYDQRAAYGSTYAMVGHIALSADNGISLIDSRLAGWGDSLDGLTNGSYDPATKTVRWTAKYITTYDFNVIATAQ